MKEKRLNGFAVYQDEDFISFYRELPKRMTSAGDLIIRPAQIILLSNTEEKGVTDYQYKHGKFEVKG